MTARGCGRTVMVVEDDADVREAIAEVLTDCQYKALHAANGAEALQRLRAADVRPCLILVVVLSAHADGSEAAAKLDAAGYLPKPVSLETLVSLVERFCAVGQE